MGILFEVFIFFLIYSTLIKMIIGRDGRRKEGRRRRRIHNLNEEINKIRREGESRRRARKKGRCEGK